MVEMESGKARAQTHDLVTHDRGRAFSSAGTHKSALAQQTDPHEHEQDVFAARVARVLDNGRLHGTFASLSLIAAPRMLGRLRDALAAQTRARVIDERSADLTHVPTDELARRLRLTRPPLPLQM
jgi:protein required for attachment to host cells